jgi:hypothetical protein
MSIIGKRMKKEIAWMIRTPKGMPTMCIGVTEDCAWEKLIETCTGSYDVTDKKIEEFRSFGYRAVQVEITEIEGK